MEPTPDELAGVAGLFSGITREEFHRAFENVAARQGTEFDPADLDDRIEAARRGYYLVGIEQEGTELLAPGPAALPALPEHAEDLPHMMDVPDRGLAPADLAGGVEDRLEADAEAAIGDGDVDRLRTLLDVCYDARAWGPVDVDALQEHLAGAAEEL